MKRCLAILLLLAYTAFSAVAMAQVRYACSSLCTEESPVSSTQAPKAYHEHEVAGRQEPPLLYQRHHTHTPHFSSKILRSSHSEPTRAAAVPVYIRHCVFIL